MAEAEFIDSIAEIASGLGIAAEKIFGIFAGAQPIVGIIELAAIVIAILLAYLVAKVMWKPIKKQFTDHEGNWDDDDAISTSYFAFIVVAAIAFMVLYCILGGAIAPSIMKIVCPEYMAAKEIIELVIP